MSEFITLEEARMIYDCRQVIANLEERAKHTPDLNQHILGRVAEICSQANYMLFEVTNVIASHLQDPIAGEVSVYVSPNQ